MLYTTLKALFNLLTKVFYRSITVENADRVPQKGPVILVSNHPNTMMDPVLLTLGSGRNPHFLGKSTLFNSKISRWFFGQGKVIPVYRKMDAEKEMHRNTQSFERCYEVLEQGEAIVIMPEGISQMDGTIHPLKTGTARIALNTEARNDFSLGVTIVPAGINYADPTRFNQDVYCRFGKPIEMKAFQSLYQEDEVEAVYQLTEQIQEALQKLTTTVKAPETATLLDHLNMVYKQELITDMGLENPSKHDEFAVTRGMADAIDWFYENEPKRTAELQHELRSYLAKLEGLQLRDDLLTTREGKRTFLRRLWQGIEVLFGFPVYVYGLINNLIPYRIPRLVVKRLKPSKEFRSTYVIVSGLVAYVIMYILQTVLVFHWVGNVWIALIYLVSLLPSGKFALYYKRLLANYRQHLRLFTLLSKRKTLFMDIIHDRVELINALGEARRLYVSRQEESMEEKPGSKTGGDDLET